MSWLDKDIPIEPSHYEQLASVLRYKEARYEQANLSLLGIQKIDVDRGVLTPDQAFTVEHSAAEVYISKVKWVGSLELELEGASVNLRSVRRILVKPKKWLFIDPIEIHWKMFTFLLQSLEYQEDCIFGEIVSNPVDLRLVPR